MLVVIYRNNEIIKYIETDIPEFERSEFFKMIENDPYKQCNEYRFVRYYGQKKFTTTVRNGEFIDDWDYLIQPN